MLPSSGVPLARMIETDRIRSIAFACSEVRVLLVRYAIDHSRSVPRGHRPRPLRWKEDAQMSSAQDPQSCPARSRRTSPSRHHRLVPRAVGALADGMLRLGPPLCLDGHARITLPGTGAATAAVDGLEGFARTFLLAGFRLAGSAARTPAEPGRWYAEGICRGHRTPSSPTAVGSPSRARVSQGEAARSAHPGHDQALDWTRLNPRCSRSHRLPCPCREGTYRVPTAVVRLVVRLPAHRSPALVGRRDGRGLALHDSFLRPDGMARRRRGAVLRPLRRLGAAPVSLLWGADRPGRRARGPRRARDTAQLDRFLRDAVALVGRTARR